MAGENDSLDGPQVWNAEGFLDEFQRIHNIMEDRSFLFLLGAGTSVSSGIPAGGALARRWMEELFRFRFGGDEKHSIEEWATATNLGIKDFDFQQL